MRIVNLYTPRSRCFAERRPTLRRRWFGGSVRLSVRQSVGLSAQESVRLSVGRFAHYRLPCSSMLLGSFDVFYVHCFRRLLTAVYYLTQYRWSVQWRCMHVRLPALRLHFVIVARPPALQVQFGDDRAA